MNKAALAKARAAWATELRDLFHLIAKADAGGVGAWELAEHVLPVCVGSTAARLQRVISQLNPPGWSRPGASPFGPRLGVVRFSRIMLDEFYEPLVAAAQSGTGDAADLLDFDNQRVPFSLVVVAVKRKRCVLGTCLPWFDGHKAN